MMRRLTWILAVAALMFPVLCGAQEAILQPHPIPLEGSPSTGPADAPVTLVEFLDFQSPPCQAAAPVVRKVLESHPGKVRFVIKYLPNPARESHVAIIAALSAGVQGKYWEMHDLLLEPGARYDRDSLERMAARLGLDGPRFTADIVSMRHVERLEQDKMLALRLHLAETPVFFINNRRVAGAVDFTSLKAAIDKELARAKP